MKKWKQIYELFKKSDLLNEMDLKFIEISENLLAQKHSKIVYSEFWLSDWINTTSYRINVEKYIQTLN